MDEDREQLQLRSILANLSLEIRRPLDRLQGGIGRFLDESDRAISEAERAQAQTMLRLCDDLAWLTVERLGGTTPPDQPAGP